MSWYRCQISLQFTNTDRAKKATILFKADRLLLLPTTQAKFRSKSDAVTTFVP